MDNIQIEELRKKIKSNALRPLADKFQELVRQIDSGEYELPKTIQEAETITEDYINQACDRIEDLFTNQLELAKIEAKIEELKHIDAIGDDLSCPIYWWNDAENNYQEINIQERINQLVNGDK